MSGCAFDDWLQVVEIGVVVDFRSLVLDGFPCHEETLEALTPSGQAGEVFIAFIGGEGASDEGNLLSLVKAFADLRSAVGRKRQLAVAPQVYAAQDEAASGIVDKSVAADFHACLRGLSSHPFRGRAIGKECAAEKALVGGENWV